MTERRSPRFAVVIGSALSYEEPVGRLPERDDGAAFRPWVAVLGGNA